KVSDLNTKLTPQMGTVYDELPQIRRFGGKSPQIRSAGGAIEEWDLIIRPKTGWFDLPLSELWRYRDLTLLFVWRDFVSHYKQTILGSFAHLIQPPFTPPLFPLLFS